LKSMLRDKLDRFSSHIVTSEEEVNSGDGQDRYNKIAAHLGGELCVDLSGTYVRIISDYDETYSYGRMTLDELLIPISLKKMYYDWSDDAEKIDPRKLLFFDMETTGLGGSGTVPFLIGFGSVTENGFQVRQYFLPDYPDEEAMLEAVRAEIKPDTVIVSYNGKAFDMPILTDRLIIQRVERNLKFGDHIDLLNPVRRLYRRRLRDCTLINVEKNILDFYRFDDVPGYLVPSIYFDWLNTDNTDKLEGVVEHNRNDIISLYFIMYQIAVTLENPEEKIKEPDDILSLAKMFEKRREHENVGRLLEKFDGISWAYKRYDILFLQSLAYKRSGRLSDAVALWKKIIEGSALETFPAFIELAKYYEHRVKDIREALKMTLSARDICPPRPFLRGEIQKRIGRLTKKLSKKSSSK